MLFLVNRRIIVPTGRERRLKRKSTKSFPASANKTLFPFVSIRSFKLTLEDAIANNTDRN